MLRWAARVRIPSEGKEEYLAGSGLVFATVHSSTSTSYPDCFALDCVSLHLCIINRHVLVHMLNRHRLSHLHPSSCLARPHSLELTSRVCVASDCSFWRLHPAFRKHHHLRSTCSILHTVTACPGPTHSSQVEGCIKCTRG